MNKEISDYDKYNYDYEKYWQDSDINRTYEDKSERSAITKLLKNVKTRNWFCDLGGGFGRLMDVYKDLFANVILVDYSFESLKKAKEKYQSTNTNIFFVAANAYHLPFRPDVLDCLLSVRMMHHMEDPTAAVKEMARTIKPKGNLILEFANKKHFFEVIKAVFGKSKMSPFTLEPKKRGDDLFYNFHPKFVKKELDGAGFQIQKTISVSNLRHGFFKKVLGVNVMLITEKVFQPFFNLLTFGPSIFVLAEKKSSEKNNPSLSAGEADISDILLCPKCGSDDLMILKPEIRCKKCGKTYPVIDGVYDFRVE
jgi:ubiquinone/menaquinone biosynthesis C-methylase UbiE